MFEVMKYDINVLLS